MAHHLKCPFCVQSPSVGYFYKHLITQHITEVFDDKTEWGKKNCVWLHATKPKTSSYTIYLPKGEAKYCCPACCSSFNKIYYADKHFPKCQQSSFEKLEEYKLLLKITPAEAPFASELRAENTVVNPLSDDERAKYEYREAVYKKMLYTLYCEIVDKQEWSWWLNQLTENSEVYAIFKEMREEKNFPDDEKFNMELECSKELKALKVSFEQIRTAGMKKLPTPPS
jgi:hypothetical protein